MSQWTAFTSVTPPHESAKEKSDFLNGLLDNVHKSKLIGAECFKQCSDIHELCARQFEGLKIALEATDLVVQRSGQFGSAAQNQAIATLQRYYDTASGIDRAMLAECLIDRFLWQADCWPPLKIDQLITLLDRANSVAEQAHSTMRSEIRVRLDVALTSKSLLDRVELMKKKLKADPHDKILREQIINSYLVDMNDPVGAGAMINEDIDAAHRRRLAVAAFGGAGVKPDEVLALARWYKELASKAGREARPNMLRQAVRYYKVFLLSRPLGATASGIAASQPNIATTSQPNHAPMAQTRPTTQELKNAVAAELKAITTELENLGYGPKVKDTQEYGQENDILVTTPDSRLPQGWRRTLRGFGVARASGPAMLTLSTGDTGSYDAEVQIVRSGDKGSVTFVLPVGPKQAAIVIDRGETCGLEAIAGKAAEQNPTGSKGDRLVNDRIQKLTVHVTVNGVHANIVATMDDAPLLKWQGEISRLSLPSTYKLTSPHMFGVGTDGTSDVAFLRFTVKPKPAEPTTR